MEHIIFHTYPLRDIQERHSVRDTRKEPQTVRKNNAILLNHATTCIVAFNECGLCCSDYASINWDRVILHICVHGGRHSGTSFCVHGRRRSGTRFGLGETLPDFLAWNSRFQSWLSATDGTLDDEVYGSDCPAVNSVTSVAGVSGAASVGVFGVAAAHVFVVSWIVYATGDTD